MIQLLCTKIVKQLQKQSKNNKDNDVLQGYLLIHSNVQQEQSSPLVNHRKKRWFVFNKDNGKLYYYRTKEDLFPLGEININQSSFILANPTTGVDTFRFEIRSGVKRFMLEANTPTEGFHWVRMLQQYRQSYFQRLAEPLADRSDKSYFSIGTTAAVTETTSDKSNESEFYQSCDMNTVDSHSRNKILNEQMVQPKPKFPNLSAQKRTQSLPPAKRDQKLSVPITNSDHRRPSRIFGGMFSGKPNKQLVHNIQDDSIKDVDMNCSQCQRSNGSLLALRHDKMALEDEVKTNREVIKILQEQLRIFNQSEKPTNCSDTDDPRCDDIIALKIKLNTMVKDNEKLRQENCSLSTTKQVLEEMLESRDRTLVSLTHEVYDLECKNSRMQTHAELEREFIQDEVPRKLKQKIEQLEDTAIAFEQQNYFLNKEIIELNEINRILELKHKQSEAKLCEVEAKSSQIQSKLLSLLKEINHCIQVEERNQKEVFHGIESSSSSSNSFVTNESVKQIVSRLLEESSLDIPLSWKPGNRPRSRWSNQSASNSICGAEYDELGFYHHNNERPRCYDFVLDPDKSEITWRSKWDHFMSNLTNHGEVPIGNFELKQMIRLGVPQDYRCKIWRSLIHQRVKDHKAKLSDDYYESLLRNRSKLGSQSKVLDPSAKQIELDLLRTLPNNRHFENLESDGIERLRRVLLAYSLHNPSVGYCQGLNRLAAVALLFMPEEDAFWCLVAIVETIMPKDYYGRNLLGAHVDQYVLRDLITDKLPQLSQQMDHHHIEISLFAWFLTIFVDNVPVFVYLHIWDVFLHEGSKVLFRFALAILRLHESELLQMTDSASMNQFLRTLDERQFNLQRLSDIAFRELNPFPSRLVRSKRTHYTALVIEELKKIDEFRYTLNNDETKGEQLQTEKSKIKR
ncbi:TBC1 domain member 2A [Dermatophagoides farinae]|uniref:TBC1 domain member 2A n=1 Tax=Dermatophagoides farinae TaxID=6954 RepID=A0A922HRV4_DERFA|nr:TBC1 domain member 2A [Dermatophagoides farinae]